MRIAGPAAAAAFLVLIILTAWIYAPGVTGPAMLDDISSVLVLDSLRDHPEAAVDAIFTDHSGPLGRPVTMATFVAERALFQGDLGLSKAVNIALHLVNTLLWFWVFLQLLAPSQRSVSVIMACMMPAILWAASPLFVSTVLYSVQRMAMLACFFMLLTILAYLRWRRAYLAGSPHFGRAFLVVVMAWLAVFSKETGIVVLPVLLALESLWFRWLNTDGEIDTALRNGSLAMLATGTLFVGSVLLFFPEHVFGAYRHFDFSALERLSAQAGIIWEYVMQIVWPDINRMGLHHDDATIAEYAGHDGSNLAGILAWASLFLIIPFVQPHELPAKVLFCGLFYLIGHATESTILPLELYYEHRNYFPAGGIFLLLALFLTRVVTAWPLVGPPLWIYVFFVWLLLASRTSALVQIWSSEPLLRVFQLAAHPDSYRANSDMASELAGRGELAAALEYSAVAQALAQESGADHLVRDLALSCISGKPLPLEDRFGSDSEIRALQQMTDLNTLRLMIRYLQAGSCDEKTVRLFSDMAWLEFGSSPAAVHVGAPDIYTLLAIMENANRNFERAIFYSQRLLKSRPDDVRGLLMRLHFATVLGDEHLARETREELLARDKLNELDTVQRATLELYSPVVPE